MRYQFLLHNSNPDLTFVGVVDTVTRRNVEHHKGYLGAFLPGAYCTFELKNATFKNQDKCIERIESVAKEIVTMGSLYDWLENQKSP